jgi:hypothetical protein
MLPRNIDRKRIYQEEVYRYEVRTQLDKTDEKKRKVRVGIWAFVNSAFFLWFLSSVVVAIISFSYAKWDKQKELEREQRERIALVERENIQRVKKLDAEISSRLNYFAVSQNISLLGEIAYVETGNGSLTESEREKYLEKLSLIGGKLSEDGIMSLNNPSISNYKFGNPEYANRSLRLLLMELEEIAPSQEKNEIALAYQQSVKSQSVFLKALKEIRDLKEKGKPSFIELEDKYSSDLAEFCGAFNLKRWGEPVPAENELIHIEFSKQ